MGSEFAHASFAVSIVLTSLGAVRTQTCEGFVKFLLVIAVGIDLIGITQRRWAFS